MLPGCLRELDVPPDGGKITLEMGIHFIIDKANGSIRLRDDKTGEVIWSKE